MQERLSIVKRVLYAVIVIACVLAILRILYNMGYSFYTMTDAYKYKDFVNETLGYKIYISKILRVAGHVFFYSGLIAVYVMWEKPRPKLVFILLIIALVLPGIISRVINTTIENQLNNNNFAIYCSLAYKVYVAVVPMIWVIIRWITIGKLYSCAEKKAKLILVLYMIILGAGLIISMPIFFYSWSREVTAISYYISKAATIMLYVMTIIYLKKKLGDNMPFTNAIRFIKKECTNRPPVD